MTETLIVGAVAYTPNVVPIWEGIRDYFADTDAPMDFVLFSNYGRQVDALLAGTHRHRLEHQPRLGPHRRADRRRSAAPWRCATPTPSSRPCFVARAGAGLDGSGEPARPTAGTGIPGLRAGRDPAACTTSREAGLGSDAVELLRIDSDVGKHGDTGRSELDALRAVLDGRRRRRGHRHQHLGRRSAATS